MDAAVLRLHVAVEEVVVDLSPRRERVLQAPAPVGEEVGETDRVVCVVRLEHADVALAETVPLHGRMTLGDQLDDVEPDALLDAGRVCERVVEVEEDAAQRHYGNSVAAA